MKKEKCFPLSLSQQNIWNLERALPGTSVNNISTTVRIEGQLDFPVLQESIHRVLQSDTSLCTRMTMVDGELMQYHAPYEREDFPVYDFTNTSKEGMESWETAVTRERIPVEDGPLYRFVLFRDTEASGGVLVKLHHIIADGWSQIMICNKIAQTYLQLLSGEEPTLEEAPDYELHVMEEQKYLASKAYGKDEKYWKQILELSGEPSVLKAVNSASVSPVGRRMSFELPQVLNHAIYSFCQEKRVAPFAVFYMALAVYFKRIGGTDRFTIGVPIFNRTNYQFKQSTGMFVTTLPFYNEINDEWTLNEFNEELMEKWYEMLRHQRYPFSHITRLAGGEGRLFHIALSYQDSKIFESRDTSVMLSGRWHYCGYQAEQLTIHLTNLRDHKKYAVDYDYLAQFFTEEEITRLHHNLCHILNEALAEPDKSIHQLRVLSMEEMEQLLYTFNETDRYLEERSVYDALVCSSDEYTNRVALICDGERMTYGSLLHRSERFAAVLREQGLEEDALVAILLPRKFDLFAAMVGTLKAGCGYLVLSEETPVERLRHILKQSGASLLITGEKGKARLEDCPVPMIMAEDVVANKRTAAGRQEADNRAIGEGAVEKKLSGDRLAYVVYTSGSTGEPKGVEITHRNVLNLSQEMCSVYGQGAVLSVCNVGFDAFMLESIVALLNGRTIVLPAEEELESPERLAALINGYAVGYFAMTPSRLSALLQNRAFRSVMWKMESIVCGGEAFPAELLKKLKKLTHARIYNQYGPSETTVAVSMKELSHADRITAGRPMGNCRLYVLDQWMNPLPVGGYGQLYVGGKCVGRGYRNRPELTAKSFRENPFVVEDRIYSTGDIATWTPEGEIVLTGRLDRQVKLRGLRIEPQEVASCVESYPGVFAAAARVCEMNGQSVLGAYYCAQGHINEAQLLAHLATYLPRYMVPAFLIRLEEMPMNANGKVDEARLPMPQDVATDYRMSDTAQVILDIFRTVLQQESMQGGSDYFLAGGNSLNAMESIARIEERLGRRVRIADLYACRSAWKLAAFLDGDLQSQTLTPSAAPAYQDRAGHTFRKAPLHTEYDLSPIQQGIYIQTILDGSGFAYHMPGAFVLKKEPDRERLTAAFAQLIREDAILRTAYVQEAGKIYARVAEEVAFEVEHLTADDFAGACEAFLRPFDLERAPLIRAALWKSDKEEWYLFVDVHHIIGDGLSTPLLLKRLDKAYGGETIRTEWNYYDYLYTVETSANQETGDAGQDLDYWVNHLQELPEPLVLPADHVRPKRFDYQGKEYELMLTEAESEACANYCREKGISEYVLFLAAFGILLSQISGREDFVIGTPVAGRRFPQTGEICGPFINTLPLRIRPEAGLTVNQWISRVQEEVTGLLDHQQVSLEEIIQALKLPRGEQNALYQVMLTQSPVDETALLLDGEPMNYVPVTTGAVKMDMIVELARKERPVLRFSYATSVFLQETICFYGRCMKQILRALVRGQDIAIGQLTVLCPEDYQKYVEGPNYEVTPFVNLPIHKQLHNKVMAMGENTAVIFHGERTSYAQLERRANAIAAFLTEKGLQSGQCVGLCLGRTPDMIAAMYAVLKAGGVYAFMLPSFPAARLKIMLEASDARLLLYDEIAQKQLVPEFMEEGFACAMERLPEGEEESFADRPMGAEGVANVLFTSGSTGKPKGVMLRHRSLSNLCSQMKALLDPIEGTVLCSTNSVFDCFVVETLIALSLGRTVVLADEEEMMLPWKLAKLVDTYQTGIFEMTPSRLQMCLANEAFCKAAHNIRIVLLGGEVLTKTLLEQFYAHSDGILMNMYGPTEATVFTTMAAVRPADHITVGRPLMNTRTYVLDEKRRPVIPTACGELYIAGECLAAGYASQPELTERSFIDDIYFPGEKMYRSGDLVRLRLDGTFDFMGRRDVQVKLNGQRVELMEITGAILQSGCVKQAATVAVHKEDGSMELCAFYQAVSPDKGQEEITAYLTKILPAYMIPSRIICVEEMPMTATNKIDMQTLQKMAVEGRQNVCAAEAPQPVTELSVETKPQKVEITVTSSYILSVWNRVLSAPATDPEVSFFELGGTSMDALRVLSHYYNDHLEMSLSDFYSNPTALSQAKLLGAVTNEAAVGHGQSEDQCAPEERAEKAVLITGATGFFGAHLLKELLEQGQQKVICLVRDGGEQRLHETLSWYFGREYTEAMASRIEVAAGDLVQDMLGLPQDAYAQLAAGICAIYHCAADVRHYAADAEKYLNINVDGTARMLELARQAKASFYHMSTLSISGEQLKDGSASKDFTEEDYDIGQIWENNIYVKSKFLAEGLVLQAAEEGLDVKIMRLGRLVGRACDGKFQRNPKNNAFYLLMKGFCQIGAVPKMAAGVKIDLMPVDVCAKEVLTLTESDGRIYHIMSHDQPTLEEVVKALDESVRVVSDYEFIGILDEKSQTMDRELLAMLMNYWHSMRLQKQTITVTNDLTMKALTQAGYVPEIPAPEQILKGFVTFAEGE